jgi:hypothetical protein
VLVGGGAQWLHLGRLLEVRDFGAEVAGWISEAEMEDVVRTFHAAGLVEEGGEDISCPPCLFCMEIHE